MKTIILLGLIFASICSRADSVAGFRCTGNGIDFHSDTIYFTAPNTSMPAGLDPQATELQMNGPEAPAGVTASYVDSNSANAVITPLDSNHLPTESLILHATISSKSKNDYEYGGSILTISLDGRVLSTTSVSCSWYFVPGVAD